MSWVAKSPEGAPVSAASLSAGSASRLNSGLRDGELAVLPGRYHEVEEKTRGREREGELVDTISCSPVRE